MSALLIIDLQNDFCEGGSLAVSGGNSLVTKINSLIDSKKWDLIIASQDWHPSSHISFATTHNAKPFTECTIQNSDKTKSISTTLWPVHCVQNTHGADFVEGLNTKAFDAVIKKGTPPGSEFYSAFEDVFGENQTSLLSILHKHHIKEVVIVGLAYDFCVKNTALSAARAGFKTIVDTGYTKAISEASAKQATSEMEKEGITIL